MDCGCVAAVCVPCSCAVGGGEAGVATAGEAGTGAGCGGGASARGMVVSSVPGAKVGADGNDAEGAEAVANGGAEFGDAPPVAAPNKFGAGGVWPSPVLAAAAGEAGADV